MDNNENGKSPELSVEELDNLIREVGELEEFVDEPSRRFDHATILAILSEYLDTFTLFGYSSEGDEVVLNCTKSRRDARALQGLIEEYLNGRLDSKLLDDFDDED